LPGNKRLAGDRTWASRRCVGSASHLRHWRRCFPKLEIFYVLRQRCHEPNGLDRWRRYRICHIAELVSEGRIPIHRIQQQTNYDHDFQSNRKCHTRRSEFSLLADQRRSRLPAGPSDCRIFLGSELPACATAPIKSACTIAGSRSVRVIPIGASVKFEKFTTRSVALHEVRLLH
jgi:hypothetical protein